MRVLACDPGSQRSAYVLLADGMPERWGHLPNREVRELMNDYSRSDTHLAIEYVYLRGMKVFQQAIDTVFWVGQFAATWNEGGNDTGYTLINRLDVKMALCGDSRANDGNIRTAIIDSFGGPDVAIGGKRCQACHGKGWRGRGRKLCSDCLPKTQPAFCGGGPEHDNHVIGNIAVDTNGMGTGLETPRGPLHAFAKDGSGGLGHRWSALAVGLTWISQQEG